MKELVFSTDLDGVIIKRLHPLQLRALAHFLARGSAIYQPPSQIPEIDRSVHNGPLSLFERILYQIHKGRRVLPGVRQCLDSMMEEADIVANTGRPNKKLWIDLTLETLRNSGVLECFKDFFFTPREIEALLSKAAAIDQLQNKYQEVIHIDDNPADVLPLAKLFPDVRFIIVQDLTAGILFSRVEMGEYPNVQRVATLRAGITNLCETPFR